jgi:hypothetical protein
MGRKKIDPSISYTLRIRPELSEQLDTLYLEFKADPKWRKESLPSYARFLREVLIAGAEVVKKEMAARKP